MVTNGVTVIAVDGTDVTFIVGAASGAPVTNGLGDGAVRVCGWRRVHLARVHRP
jgi:hypothetical protein